MTTAAGAPRRLCPLEQPCTCEFGPHRPCWACAAWRRLFRAVMARAAAAQQPQQRRRSAA